MSQSKLINATRTKTGRTANNAITHETSLKACVDMFFLAGASRNMPESDIITLWESAKSEDITLAYKILFWARDCRGGAGERRFFRVIWHHVFATDPDIFRELYTFVPEYGRWDDLFFNADVAGESCEYLYDKLVIDKDRLLAKWLPRKGNIARMLRSEWEMSPKQYRKTLSTTSETVEQLMCDNQWDEITYSHVPSVAMNKYRKAFFRHDEDRFRNYLGDVEAGNDKINADVLFPHSLFQAFSRGEDRQAIRTQWNALPDYMEESEERIIPVCDVSGSMSGLPMDVSVSLGCYISERNRSIFKDAFITFSGKPTMQVLKGDVCSRFDQLRRADWEMNTNLQGVFDLILSKGLEHDVPESDMPTKILIISDMEFDQATTSRGSYWSSRQTDFEPTNFEEVKRKYKDSGYKMPQVIFWNVNGRLGNVPVQFNEKGVGLVSGFSPSILKAILAGEVLSPEGLVRRAVETERYAPINI